MENGLTVLKLSIGPLGLFDGNRSSDYLINKLSVDYLGIVYKYMVSLSANSEVENTVQLRVTLPEISFLRSYILPSGNHKCQYTVVPEKNNS